VEELQVLNRLGTALLSVRRPDEVITNAAAALRLMLPTGDVEVSLAGAVNASLQAVKVPGAEPAVIGVSPDLPPRVVAAVEAAAGLLGMALQRVALETEVAEGQRAQAALSGQILEEGTRERSRIALAIHDEVLPFLAAAEIQADNVRSAIGGGDVARADGLAGATREAVHGGIAHLRDVLEALRRQIVVPGGLRQGLVQALEELRVTGGVSHTLEAPDPLPPLPLAVEIMVLELVRGCLTNIARHAGASHVSVRLDTAPAALQVEVADDGRGFDPAAVSPDRQGLALMAQRTELARGTFTVHSTPGSGTRVRMEVPV
ncbi:MAG TPA: ATP-binding protein, partial [Cryptosporangiaceae bacterium]|nr:ATP-binding protein [Cryptosporangiaceae bacterium]